MYSCIYAICSMEQLAHYLKTNQASEFLKKCWLRKRPTMKATATTITQYHNDMSRKAWKDEFKDTAWNKVNEISLTDTLSLVTYTHVISSWPFLSNGSSFHCASCFLLMRFLMRFLIMFLMNPSPVFPLAQNCIMIIFLIFWLFLTIS